MRFAFIHFELVCPGRSFLLTRPFPEQRKLRMSSKNHLRCGNGAFTAIF